MAVTGPPQLANKIGRTTNAGWNEVPDTPYTGPSMDLPKLPGAMVWMPEVVAWWDQVRTMPHCVLWSATDWLFALETAYLKNDFWLEFFGGQVHTTKITEIRRREDQIGTTVEARRKLLIRYLPAEQFAPAAPLATPAAAPVTEDAEGEAGSATVTSLSGRRKRLATG